MQVVLLGDQKQLGTVVKYHCLEKSSLKVSMFERIWSAQEKMGGTMGMMLCDQYRMHPSIGTTISHISYHGQLRNMVTAGKARNYVISSICIILGIE